MKSFSSLLYCLAIVVLLVSCTNSEPQEIDPQENDAPKEKRYLSDEDIKRHIENQLHILPTEDYSIEIYEEHLDTDDSLDKVITVNLLNRAIKEAELENKVENRAKLGYMGNYNFLFYVDGKTQVITSPIPVPSSPHYKLKVAFTYLTSPSHKDLIVDCRIRRSQYRKFYSIRERVPIQVSESEVYKHIGEKEFEAYSILLEDAPGELWKSIAIYKGSGESVIIDDLVESYQYEPTVEKTEELVRKWYFSNKFLKYYLRNDEM